MDAFFCVLSILFCFLQNPFAQCSTSRMHVWARASEVMEVELLRAAMPTQVLACSNDVVLAILVKLAMHAPAVRNSEAFQSEAVLCIWRSHVPTNVCFCASLTDPCLRRSLAYNFCECNFNFTHSVSPWIEGILSES